MGSMDKIKTDEKTLNNWLKKYNGEGYVLSDKLDGISALYVIDEDNKENYIQEVMVILEKILVI